MKSESDFFNLIDRSNPLDSDAFLLKKAKIVCTMGPSTEEKKVLTRLIRSGMDVARLNFSHGSHEEHLSMMKNLRAVAKKEDKFLGILQDVQGPKIRVGRFKNSKAFLKKGAKFSLTTDSVVGDESIVSCSYKKLHKEVKPGHRILLDDGLIFLVVENIKGKKVECRVVFGGELKNNKGVNLPDTRLSLSCLTAKDRKDIEFGLKNGVDFIALSFISDADEIKKVKRLISKHKEPPPLIAKIETRLAVHNIESIVEAADGIMVARGDLGVECPLEKVPGLQKRIIRAANRAGKFVITATQMLESMTRSPRPTRAEASDVANAVLDGTDAVMLSAETATGDFPVEAVKTMSRIVLRTEEYVSSLSDIQDHRLQEASHGISEAVSAAAVQITRSLHASAVVAFTHSGKTARSMSRLRPDPLIFALSPFENICRRLSIVWGVVPGKIRKMKHTDDMPSLSKKILQQYKLWKKKARIVMLSGTPVSRPGSTNLAKVYEVK